MNLELVTQYWSDVAENNYTQFDTFQLYINNCRMPQIIDLLPRISSPHDPNM